MVTNTSDWPIPEELSAEGQKAAETIRRFLEERGMTYHGGGGRFYTPAQWAERGEEWGLRSLLVITHDGGAHAACFNWAYEQEDLIEELASVLAAVGLRAEQCASWYSAIYPLSD